MRIRNPIIPGFHPDPSICRVGDDYYLVNSSFEYYPGVPLFHSRDLAHWRQIGHCLTRESQLPLGKAWISGGIMAPTIRWHEGLFYMITTNGSAGGNFLVTAADAAGPWSEPLWLEVDGIDPDLFWDDDGICYVTSSGRSGGRCRIVQTIIDPVSGAIMSPSRDIWEGTGHLGPEGPHLFRIGECYYLMIAEGGTEYGHTEVIARGPTPSGPWESCPRNPVLTHRSTGLTVQAVGHADLVQAADGGWWAVCLGIRPAGYHWCHNLGRETFLAPLRWDSDGWPVIGNNGRLPDEFDGPALTAQPWPEVALRDDFKNEELDLQWNFVKNPLPQSWSLTERPGWLTLWGQAGDLDNVYPTPCVLGRRQEHWECAVSAHLDFAPATASEEAGLVVYQNMLHHYELAVVLRDGQRLLTVRRRIGSLQAEVAAEVLPEGPLELRVESDRKLYRLGVVRDGRFAALAEGETRYLSTEVGGRFSGVYFSMYATGHGAKSSVPACFDWFEYREGG